MAKYFATGGRDVSIHSCVDSDSVVPCLPDAAVAWHCKGFNSVSLGIEMCMDCRDWADVPPDYARGMVANAVTVVAGWCVAHNLPPRLVSKKQALAGTKGVSYHRLLDPSRRSDPGPGFPEDEFFGLLRTAVDAAKAVASSAASGGLWFEQSAEFAEAVRLGITDGSRAGEPATRAEAAVMALRAGVSGDSSKAVG